MTSADQQSELFAALAHEARRQILDLVRASPGINVKALCREFDVSRIAVLKHINVLENVDLMITEKVGRDRMLYFNPVPIQQIYERWTDQYSSIWASHVTDLKSRLEKG